MPGSKRMRMGCAGWALPTLLADDFPGEGTHLHRYARQFPAVEINSSFYRPHRWETYRRWAESVPEDFRFSVKVPKAITHVHRLKGVSDLLLPFLDQVAGLGKKLGPLLVQLPPSLWLEPKHASHFFSELRLRFRGAIVCEPRHRTWFTADAQALFAELDISRAGADPAPVPSAAQPLASRRLVYYRLHGSPQMYYSAYSGPQLEELFLDLQGWSEQGIEAWCVFDNTALGAALPNAMTMRSLVENATPYRRTG